MPSDIERLVHHISRQIIDVLKSIRDSLTVVESERIVDVVYDKTSDPSGAGILAADIETSKYNSVLVCFFNNGPAASTGLVVAPSSMPGANFTNAPAAPAANAGAYMTLSESFTPPPTAIHVGLTAGAASTVRIRVEGIRTRNNYKRQPINER